MANTLKEMRAVFVEKRDTLDKLIAEIDEVLGRKRKVTKKKTATKRRVRKKRPGPRVVKKKATRKKKTKAQREAQSKRMMKYWRDKRKKAGK